MKVQPALLLVAFLTCWPFVSLADQNVQARFEKSLAAVRSLSNVEIDFLDTLTILDPAGLKAMKVTKPMFSQTIQYSYLASGQRYRAVDKLVSGTETNLVKGQESAYDGKTYVRYNGDQRYMTKGKTPPIVYEGEDPFNPLVAPYVFLSRQSDDKKPPRIFRFSDLVATDFTNGLILPPMQRLNGLVKISMVDAPGEGQPAERNITLDEAGDEFTPREIETIRPGYSVQTVRLLNYTNLAAYQFPTRVEWTMSSCSPTSPPVLLMTGTVVMTSARLPEHIEDSMFRLDEEEKSAVTIWNWDQRNFGRVAPQYSNAIAMAKLRPKIYDETANGDEQIADALNLAGKQHKQVLLMFGANACGWCYRLHALFGTNALIATELKSSYLVVMVDRINGHNNDVEDKYGTPSRFGWPAVVILGTDGRQLTTQDTGKWVDGDHYSPDRVKEFLKKWEPKSQTHHGLRQQSAAPRYIGVLPGRSINE